MPDTSESSRQGRPPRKDRLVQARVPQELEQTLKQEAQRRQLTVSHLVRTVLEDAFDLVDGVVQDVDRIVSDSVNLARHLGRSTDRDRDERTEPPRDVATGDDLSHVFAWNEVVLNRPATCSSCGGELAQGQRAHTGLSDDPRAPRAWRCQDCIAKL